MLSEIDHVKVRKVVWVYGGEYRWIEEGRVNDGLWRCQYRWVKKVGCSCLKKWSRRGEVIKVKIGWNVEFGEPKGECWRGNKGRVISYWW